MDPNAPPECALLAPPAPLAVEEEEEEEEKARSPMEELVFEAAV